ncbi:hypothetical protein ACMD2_24155 [Ananas comosus]|uniref:CCHC-type domain-containing protein n=1 Tax=Ananas comosus TaxID=4615 RepID=A0A199VUL6_ANACO|nr:hypothetical protein ACMD2_24155 [Ananas comosus]
MISQSSQINQHVREYVLKDPPQSQCKGKRRPQRFKPPVETKAKKLRTCQLCKKKGHNRRTCKEASNISGDNLPYFNEEKSESHEDNEDNTLDIFTLNAGMGAKLLNILAKYWEAFRRGSQRAARRRAWVDRAAEIGLARGSQWAARGRAWVGRAHAVSQWAARGQAWVGLRAAACGAGAGMGGSHRCSLGGAR